MITAAEQKELELIKRYLETLNHKIRTKMLRKKLRKLWSEKK